MKKPIEEMFLYKLNYYFCRIFLTSLISNALFALVLGCLFTLGLVLSARVAYLIYFLMMYPSYYLSVHYLAEKRYVGGKKKSNGCVSSLRCFSCLSLFLQLIGIY